VRFRLRPGVGSAQKLKARREAVFIEVAGTKRMKELAAAMHPVFRRNRISN